MKKLQKMVCLLMVVMIFASVVSVEAWADNNVWQMMENGETWVDENGHTWMPAPEPDGETINATGAKQYSWVIPANTTYYTQYQWRMQYKQKIRVRATCIDEKIYATGIQGCDSYKYRTVFGANDSYDFPIDATDDYRYYVENFQTVSITVESTVIPLYTTEA